MSWGLSGDKLHFFVVVNIVCYRKFGYNEIDESFPSFT